MICCFLYYCGLNMLDCQPNHLRAELTCLWYFSPLVKQANCVSQWKYVLVAVLQPTSSQHPCFPPWKVAAEKWTSIFKVALCVLKRWPVSEGSWLWLWNAAALCLLPTGDCEASVNTKILSFLLPLYPLTHFHSLYPCIYIQSNAHMPHTHAHTLSACTCDSQSLSLYGTHARECHGPGCKWLRHFAIEPCECFISCPKS